MLKEVVEFIWLLFVLEKKEYKRYLDFSINFNVIFLKKLALCQEWGWKKFDNLKKF